MVLTQGGSPTLAPQSSGTTQRLQAVSVVNERVVWAGGTGGTWARTTDGGAHWRSGKVPDSDSLEFRDVHGIDSSNAFLLAAGPGTRSRIYRTYDGGETWALQFWNRDKEAFYDCFAFWSAWSGLAFSDAVAGEFPLLRTLDGGQHWLRRRSLPPATKGEGGFAASGTCVATFSDSLAWIATGAGEAARVFRTTDRGFTWAAASTPIAQGTATSGHASVAFRSRTQGIAVGGDIADTITVGANSVVTTSDGGATWTQGGALSFPGAAYGAAWVPQTPGTVVAVGPRGASWSTDGGNHWLPLDTLSYWSVAFAGPNAGWMVGPGGRITKVRLP